MLNNVAQGDKTIDNYFTDLNAIWEELENYRPMPHCQCGGCNSDCFQKFVEIKQEDYVYRFLNGLNEERNAQGRHESIVETIAMAAMGDQRRK